MHGAAFAFLLALALVLALALASGPAVVATAYDGAPAGELFGQLRRLLDAEGRHGADEPDHYAAVLDADARYTHHGRGVCTGRAQVVGCLLKEREELAARGRLHQRTETLAGPDFHIARVETDIHTGGVADRPQRQLDVYVVRVAGTPPAIVELERMSAEPHPHTK